MRRAYTAIQNTPPHLDVGPTFTERECAEEFIEDKYHNEIWEVTLWVEKSKIERNDSKYGYNAFFLFRTDMNHEVSYVVADSLTELSNSGNEAAVGTRINPEYNTRE